MSKIVKLPIKYDGTAHVSQEGHAVKVSGPKGTLELTLPKEVKVNVENNVVTVTRKDDTDRSKAMHGLIRTLIANIFQYMSDFSLKTTFQ